mgnify:FL=1
MILIFPEIAKKKELWKARKKMTQFESRNITMMMDLYEMTMAYGYFKENDTEKKVQFQ